MFVRTPTNAMWETEKVLFPYFYMDPYHKNMSRKNRIRCSIQVFIYSQMPLDGIIFSEVVVISKNSI